MKYYLIYQSPFEILFRTRFSTRFSTISSTIFENKNNTVLVPLLQQLLTTQLFLNKIPYTLPLFQKKLALSIAEASILETSIFYHIFTSFHRGWGVRYFKQISTSSRFSKISILLHKRLYISCSFRKKLAVFIANVFRDIHVLPFFYHF